MGRVSAIIGGILVLAVLAGVLTEATLAVGHRGGIADDATVRPKASVTPTPSATPKVATPTPTPAVTPVSTPTPVATPAFKTATTSSFVHMRAGKSTSTAIMYDLNGGTVVRLLPDSDAQWQQVQYNGSTGYVFKAYLVY
jgi:uncharacterized protein YgiM (DUF1202 family)